MQHTTWQREIGHRTCFVFCFLFVWFFFTIVRHVHLLRADIHSYTKLYATKGRETKPNYTMSEQLLHKGTQSRTARQSATTDTHSYDMLCNAHVKGGVCEGWSIDVGPLSTTVVPLHLTQLAVQFVQIVTTVCLQGA